LAGGGEQVDDLDLGVLAGGVEERRRYTQSDVAVDELEGELGLLFGDAEALGDLGIAVGWVGSPSPPTDGFAVAGDRGVTGFAASTASPQKAALKAEARRSSGTDASSTAATASEILLTIASLMPPAPPHW
jgi:hypothetical protein